MAPRPAFAATRQPVKRIGKEKKAAKKWESAVLLSGFFCQISTPHTFPLVCVLLTGKRKGGREKIEKVFLVGDGGGKTAAVKSWIQNLPLHFT